jgi:hypothetical protein
MSRPSELARTLAALALLVPAIGWCGVTVGTPAAAAAPVRPVVAEPPAPAAGLYQIRCWQHGRLLFEDRITLPADAAAYGIRVSGVDRNGKPMYLAETRTSTCLVRLAPDERYWPR